MAQRGAAAAGGPASAAEALPAGVTPTADARRLLSRDTLRALVQHVLGEQARASMPLCALLIPVLDATLIFHPVRARPAPLRNAGGPRG